ncbi:hypothetical protein [Pseudomonas poae]|uniref:hypothetical protein n=1 Tax=Pseudomonas poae TaxID=200451 RepID=UPI000714EC38|nr:hypothetical protein [Pseudomonas poae]KRP50950.1 hypothetical protein TU75_12200 [Pseudomonas poae]
MINEFLAFGSWLQLKIGNQRAALSIHRHLDFFMLIDEKWGVMPPPEHLLMQIGICGTRRARVPLRWLASVRGYVISDASLEEHVERDRIRQIMTELSCDGDSTLLSGYQAELETRVSMGTLKLRSLRACLRAAVDLLHTAKSKGKGIVEQHQIDNLLKIKPGIAANLWGFISFLNARRG